MSTTGKLCQFEELAGNPGKYTCTVCGVHTIAKVESLPIYRNCPADPIGRRNRIELGLPDFRAENLEPPDGLADDLKLIGIEPEEEGINSIRQLYNRWRISLERWQTAGKPTRDDRQVEEALAICKGCEHYGTRVLAFGYCKKCGCHVNSSGIGELNKIRMATEDCPLEKWPKIAPKAE